MNNLEAVKALCGTDLLASRVFTSSLGPKHLPQPCSVTVVIKGTRGVFLSPDNLWVNIYMAPKSHCSASKHHLPPGFKLKLVPGTVAFGDDPSV